MVEPHRPDRAADDADEADVDSAAVTPDDIAAARPRDAYVRLRVAILSGELEAGRSYSQAELSDGLGVGRTPLREAIRRLQTEGLLESERNRKIRVAPLDLADLTQVYAMRVSLESLATQISVPRLSDEDLTELTVTLDAHRRAGDSGEVELAEELHMRFHELLTVHAGARIQAAVVELAEHAERYRRQYYRNRAISLAHFELGFPEHESLLEAARQRDAQRATTLTAQHLTRIAMTLAATVDVGYPIDEVHAALRIVVDPVTGLH